MSKNAPVVVAPVVNNASAEHAIESKEQLVARLLAEVEALKAVNEALTRSRRREPCRSTAWGGSR